MSDDGPLAQITIDARRHFGDDCRWRARFREPPASASMATARRSPLRDYRAMMGMAGARFILMPRRKSELTSSGLSLREMA